MKTSFHIKYDKWELQPHQVTLQEALKENCWDHKSKYPHA